MLTLETRPQFKTLLDAASVKSPQGDRPAIIFFQNRDQFQLITRREFLTAAADWAGRLAKIGISSGDLVAIAHGQRPETAFAFWGALILGAVPSLFSPLTEKLDPNIYFSSMQRLVEFAGPKCLILSSDLVQSFQSAIPCPVIAIDQLKAPAENRNFDFRTSPPPETVAFLQHSSGTTGLQKGVALSHSAVLNQIASLTSALELEQNEVVVSWLPLYHDMGLIAGFLLPLIQGIPLVLLDPLEWARRPAAFLEAITQFKGTRCWLPNFAYNHLARRVRRGDLADVDLSSMKQFINCSEPVQAASHAIFMDRFSNVGATPTMLGASYAMAENTFAVTQTAPGQTPFEISVDPDLLRSRGKVEVIDSETFGSVQLISSGRVIQGSEAKIIDNLGSRLPDRHVGEIAIRSHCMLSGYHRRPDLEPIVDGWYQTGDTGFFYKGNLFVIGRQKEMIIHAGKNIFPQDIEFIVNGIEGVSPGRNVVFGVYDDQEGTELLAVVAETARDLEPAAMAALKRSIRQKVGRESQVTVAYVDIVPPRWLIKTSSGKIARGANREKWLRENPLP